MIDTSNDTLGKKIADTEQAHRSLGYVEVGDLVNSFGKDYMKGLMECIESHAFVKTKFYIQVVSKHLEFAPHRGMKATFCARNTEPLMADTEDLFSYDPVKSLLKLEWSLPHRYEMGNILMASDLYDKKFVSDIKKFLKLSKLTLKDLKGVAV